MPRGSKAARAALLGLVVAVAACTGTTRTGEANPSTIPSATPATSAGSEVSEGSAGSSSASTATPDPVTPAADPLVVGYGRSPNVLPLLIVHDQGSPSATSGDLALSWFTEPAEQRSALVEGTIDAAALDLLEVTRAAAAGADLVIVLVHGVSAGNHQLIGPEEVVGIADLAERPVGVQEGSPSHLLLFLGMPLGGLALADVETVDGTPEDLVEAYLTRDLDVIAVPVPFVDRALDRPTSRSLYTSADVFGGMPDVLAVRREVLEERPDDIRAVVDGWFAALDWIVLNDDAAVGTMAAQAGLGFGEYITYEGGTDRYDLVANQRAFGDDPELTGLSVAYETTVGFLVEIGEIDEAPRLTFDNRFVAEDGG